MGYQVAPPPNWVPEPVATTEPEPPVVVVSLDESVFGRCPTCDKVITSTTRVESCNDVSVCASCPQEAIDALRLLRSMVADGAVAENIDVDFDGDISPTEFDQAVPAGDMSTTERLRLWDRIKSWWSAPLADGQISF